MLCQRRNSFRHYFVRSKSMNAMLQGTGLTRRCFITRDRVLAPTPSAHGQTRPPAARVSFAATSDSRDTRRGKARP